MTDKVTFEEGAVYMRTSKIKIKEGQRELDLRFQKVEGDTHQRPLVILRFTVENNYLFGLAEILEGKFPEHTELTYEEITERIKGLRFEYLTPGELTEAA